MAGDGLEEPPVEPGMNVKIKLNDHDFGPIPMANSGHIMPALLAKNICPYSWTVTRTPKTMMIAIGMGPKIFSFRKDETLYTIRILPVGGYVRMAGDGLEEPPVELLAKNICPYSWTVTRTPKTMMNANIVINELTRYTSILSNISNCLILSFNN
jgi:hypothetical protein